MIDPRTRFPLGEYQGEFALGKGNKRIRIVFPRAVALILKNMELKNATHIRAVKKREKVLFAYGDSITQGYDTLHPSSIVIYTSNQKRKKFKEYSLRR